MKSEDVQAKWDAIERLPRENDYDVLLLSAECICEIFIGVSPEGNRCLILRLPRGFNFDFHPIERDKLSLTKVDPQNYVVVTLLDSSFTDLFNDLIVSMHNAIKEIAEVDAYSRIFIQTFNKWAKFFDKAEQTRLPDHVIIGLFGEMLMLRKLLTENNAGQVNEILSAWRGPFDQLQDFVLEDRNIEVKTRGISNAGIKISNESQLDQVDAKGIELAVVIVERDSTSGISIKALSNEIVARIENSLGDTSKYYLALRQKKLGQHNLHEYDNLPLRPVEIAIFNCLSDGFPRLTRSELSDVIFDVEYCLNSDELNEHLVERVTF